MITIIADPHSYQAVSADALHASGPGDYVRIRSAIRRALNQGDSLSVHVTDRLLLHWLADLADYDGIQWEHRAPEVDYRRLFGSDPSLPFTPDLLMRLDIAHMNAPPPGREIEPVGWILGQRLDPLWSVSPGNPAHLDLLLTWTLTHTDHSETFLHPLIQQRLTIWAGDHPTYTALRAGSLITDATNVIRCIALQRYDPAWLRAHGLVGLSQNTLTLAGSLWIDALNDLAPAIECYWRERIVQVTPHTGFLHAAIERMSGWSEVELRAIENILQRHAHLLDHSLISALRRRFADLPQAAATLDEIEALIPPARPDLPHAEWNDTQWLRWATNDYMPYFTWTVRANQPREYQQECALAYEMWLAQRYPHWLTSVGSPLITRQFTLLRDLLSAQPNTVVVWLVVDGMTWWQGRILQEICRHQGLHPQRYEAGVALLPSLTNISKRGLVTGMAVSDPPHGSMTHAAREKLERAGIRSYVGYNTQEAIDALRSAEPPHCVIWLDNMLDHLAHDRPDFADDGVVRGHLEGLGQKLARMQKICMERGYIFHALIGSDHGCTFLPAGAPTRRLPQATREVVDVWEDVGDQRSSSLASARAALVNDGQRLQIDQPEAWHHLERLVYQLPQDYLVTRGYAAIGRRPSGWTHGGLTPEETIVSLMHLTPKPLVVQSLNLTISGQIRVRQAGTLSLVLLNPNPAPLDNVVIQIADLVPVVIAQIAAGGRYENTVICPARAIEGAELSLAWELQGSMLGIEQRQQGETRITVRRIQTGNDFENLFG